jgi:hypothetical protein
LTPLFSSTKPDDLADLSFMLCTFAEVDPEFVAAEVLQIDPRLNLLLHFLSSGETTVLQNTLLLLDLLSDLQDVPDLANLIIWREEAQLCFWSCVFYRDLAVRESSLKLLSKAFGDPTWRCCAINKGKMFDALVDLLLQPDDGETPRAQMLLFMELLMENQRFKLPARRLEWIKEITSENEDLLAIVAVASMLKLVHATELVDLAPSLCFKVLNSATPHLTIVNAMCILRTLIKHGSGSRVPQNIPSLLLPQIAKRVAEFDCASTDEQFEHWLNLQIDALALFWSCLKPAITKNVYLARSTTSLV